MTDETTFFKMLGFVAASNNRKKVLRALKGGDKNSSEISKELGVKTQTISKSLRQLNNAGVIVCIDEEKKKNRTYHATDIGIDIITSLDNRKIGGI